MHNQRKPGEHMEVDWAGQTAELTDPDTGEAVKVYLFGGAAVQRLRTAEAFPDQTTSSWIAAHVNAYKHFGGVTHPGTGRPENGRDKHTKDEVVLNKTYQELAEHYGTAIIPTRVGKPKDKATVEGTVGNLHGHPCRVARNQQFRAAGTRTRPSGSGWTHSTKDRSRRRKAAAPSCSHRRRPIRRSCRSIRSNWRSTGKPRFSSTPYPGGFPNYPSHSTTSSARWMCGSRRAQSKSSATVTASVAPSAPVRPQGAAQHR